MNTTPATTEIVEPPVASRRRLLRLAGAAVVGGAAASALSHGTANATVGTMQFGTTNNAGTAITTLSAAVLGGVLHVTNSSADETAVGVRGAATGGGTGVRAVIDTPTTNGWGVHAVLNGADGVGLVTEGGKASLLLGACASPATSTKAHNVGEVLMDSNKVFWVCIAAGVPGTWRSFAAPTAAGAMYPITPGRAYDSRKPSVSPLATGQTRTVSVATKYDINGNSLGELVPAGATAIAYNLTVVGTVGSNGYLAINEGGNSTVSASIINWSAAGLTLANSSLVKLNANRQITVICGGTATSCNFIIDVVGYYL